MRLLSFTLVGDKSFNLKFYEDKNLPECKEFFRNQKISSTPYSKETSAKAADSCSCMLTLTEINFERTQYNLVSDTPTHMIATIISPTGRTVGSHGLPPDWRAPRSRPFQCWCLSVFTIWFSATAVHRNEVDFNTKHNCMVILLNTETICWDSFVRDVQRYLYSQEMSTLFSG